MSPPKTLYIAIILLVLSLSHIEKKNKINRILLYYIIDDDLLHGCH